MSSLWRTTLVEARLFLREPWLVISATVLPAAILLALGAVPVLREPAPDFDGARFVELWAPTALVLGIGMVGLQQIPTVVAGYREKGILRRMSTTPVHPAQLLVAHLVVAFVATLVGAVVLIVSAWAVLDVPPPRHPFGFAAAFVVGFGAMLAIGMLIAAVAPTTKSAAGVATVAYLVTMFIGGVFLPRIFFPEPLMRAGDYTPPGAQALLEGWSGGAEVGVATAGSPQPLQLGVMALVAVVAGWAAARLFRWQ